MCKVENISYNKLFGTVARYILKVFIEYYVGAGKIYNNICRFNDCLVRL